jgi:hypothetical protein
MSQKKSTHAESCKAERSGKNANRDCNGRQWFGFAVTVRMGGVGRARGNFESSPDHNRPANVERGFNAVGD